jgi:hypothetical protein
LREARMDVVLVEEAVVRDQALVARTVRGREFG